MIREDLISSAISFLQDPSVAASSLENRVAFLRSKNLTQEEIDAALARAAGDGSATAQQSPVPPPPPPIPAQNNHGYSNQSMMIRQPGYGYCPYPGQWGGPPEPPKRDWRDWFIMATVTSGVGYAAYAIAKRYIAPLIAPPTPPQIEADKASIDASFSRAFALIDQLAADTAAVKESEAARTEKLDSTFSSLNTMIEDLKAANTRRENEARVTADQVSGLRELVPKALEGWKQVEDRKVEELGAEVRSLRKLLQNRMGGGGGGAQTPTSVVGGQALASQSTFGGKLPFASEDPDRSTQNATNTSATASAADRSGTVETQDEDVIAPAPGINVPKRDASAHRGGFGSGKAAIPAWQMAAKSKNGDAGSSDAGVGS
ncbi:MAG: hypothetical protein Q9191_003755 [Dirinaria sp. TL-2023a]